MTLAALGVALALRFVPPLPAPTPAPRAEEDEERVGSAVRFEEPAAEMRKLSALVGSWNFEVTWTEPARFKRGDYEGQPGPGGSGTLAIRTGPGGFSLVCDYDARNPMGHVTALAVIAWDPRARAFDYAEIHSAFPGVLHLTGRFEGRDLVFRGQDARGGERRAVRAVWKELGQDSWTATWSEGERGRLGPVVTRALRRGAPSAAGSPPSPTPPRRATDGARLLDRAGSFRPGSPSARATLTSTRLRAR